MKLIISGVCVLDKYSSEYRNVVNILIEDGIITKISPEAIQADNAVFFDASGMEVSPGWVDVGTHYKDPGFEWLDDLSSVSEAAAYGGYTHVIGFPNTSPVVQTKESISYFSNFNKKSPVCLHNLAAVTKDCKGEDFTDMIDLKNGGAAGFSDGKAVIHNSDVFLKTLQYLEPLRTVLVAKSEDKYLSMYGQMHEGITSTLLGLKGLPAAGEELMIMRNLMLLEYSDIASQQPLLHFSTISTAGSVQLIREAKKRGLPVSCDISAAHLVFQDNNLMNFDTNLKVYPPFRSSEDIEALREGLMDDTIDFIVSDHNSWDEEHKKLEFDAAEFGAIGLQTVFPVALSNLSIEKALEKLTYNPKHIFRLDTPTINEGQVADITLFSRTESYVLSEKDFRSKGKNSPFTGQELTGRAKAIFSNGFFKVLD